MKFHQFDSDMLLSFPFLALVLCSWNFQHESFKHLRTAACFVLNLFSQSNIFAWAHTPEYLKCFPSALAIQFAIVPQNTTSRNKHQGGFWCLWLIHLLFRLYLRSDRRGHIGNYVNFSILIYSWWKCKLGQTLRGDILSNNYLNKKTLHTL